jgi:hypothetical protein
VSADRHGAWVRALDALEADVTQVESLLAEEHRLRDVPVVEAWTPPQELGPLPLDLASRADAILNRQLRAARAVVQALVSNRRHATVAARIEAGSAGAPRPSYVDRAM